MPFIKLPAINNTNIRIEIANKLEKKGTYTFSKSVRFKALNGLVYVSIGKSEEYSMTWDTFTHVFLRGDVSWRENSTKIESEVDCN